jgi:hypothetical protein
MRYRAACRAATAQEGSQGPADMQTRQLSPEQCEAFWEDLARHFPRRPPKWRIRPGGADEAAATGERHPRGGKHGTPILSCAFSPDDSLIATAGGGRLPGADTAIRCWDAQSRREVLVCEGHDGGIFCIDFDPRTGLLASASRDCSVILWNLARRDAVVPCAADGIVKGHVAFAAAAPLLAIGETEATRGRHSSAYVLDLGTGREALRHRLPQRDAVNALAISPEGRLLALASQDLHYGGNSMLRVCNLAGGQEVFARKFEAGRVETTFTQMRFFAGGTRLAATAMELGEACEAAAFVLDAATGAVLARRPLGGIGGTLATSPDEAILACAGGKAQVELLRLPGLRAIETFQLKRMPRGARVSSVAFSFAGKLLAAGTSTGELAIFELG